MSSDKYAPVEMIFEDEKLTQAEKFLRILDQAPTCICGADCRTLRYLWDELARIRLKETGQWPPRETTPKHS